MNKKCDVLHCVIFLFLQKLSQKVETQCVEKRSTAHDLVACRSTFSSNQSVNNQLYLTLLILLTEQFWPTLLYNKVEVWTLKKEMISVLQWPIYPLCCKLTGQGSFRFNLGVNLLRLAVVLNVFHLRVIILAVE